MWEPIGSYPNRFNGTFDGKGYTVGGIYVRDGNGAVGLFGYLGSDGTIWNVGVVKSYIHGDEEAHNGGIAGSNDGKIYSCYNTGDVMDRGNTTIGGIVGELFEEGSNTNCFYLKKDDLKG